MLLNMLELMNYKPILMDNGIKYSDVKYALDNYFKKDVQVFEYMSGGTL